MRYCIACGTSHNVCKHHIKSKGSGGSDSDSNLMPLCFNHHTEVHTIGLRRFSEKYTEVKNWLERNGWDFDGRKWRPLIVP